MPYSPYLSWLDAQRDCMVQTLVDWASINTGTENLDGLALLRHLVQAELLSLAETVEEIAVPPYETVDHHGRVMQAQTAPVLLATQRPEAACRALLAIHMDTVYGLHSSFQSVTRIDDNTLLGPGVADAKGGLVVLLYALKAFERFTLDHPDSNLGWQVLINADEEIGSPGSVKVFEKLVPDLDFALLFEPSLPDGTLISSRKGSGNFSILVHGRSAHAGRDFQLGRNAIIGAAQVAGELHQLNDTISQIIVNVSRIDGGGPTNIVPDLAVVRFNIRYSQRDQETFILDRLAMIVAELNLQQGFQAELHGGFGAPPKELTPAIEHMLQDVARCGSELGLHLTWHPTGGVCDGNRLAAWGVPNIDNLGPRGGHIHSHQEYVLLDSLIERAKLTALYLMKVASGEISLPNPAPEPGDVNESNTC